DYQRSGLGNQVDQRKVTDGRFAGLSMVHRKGTEYPAPRGQYWDRPAGAKPVHFGQVAEIRPQGISGDVADEHRLGPIGSGATGADARADLGAVDRRAIGIRQARRGAMAKVLAVLIEQQDRAVHAGAGGGFY